MRGPTQVRPLPKSLRGSLRDSGRACKGKPFDSLRASQGKRVGHPKGQKQIPRAKPALVMTALWWAPRRRGNRCRAEGPGATFKPARLRDGVRQQGTRRNEQPIIDVVGREKGYPQDALFRA
jgi:hypothetical protein